MVVRSLCFVLCLERGREEKKKREYENGFKDEHSFVGNDMYWFGCVFIREEWKKRWRVVDLLRQ